MENIKINEIEKIDVKFVDGKQVIIVIYEDGEFVNVPYNDELAVALKKYELSKKNTIKHKQELEKYADADTFTVEDAAKVKETIKASKEATEKLDEAKKEVENAIKADKKEIVAIPGTEKTYDTNTEQKKSDKTEKKSNGWGYVLLTMGGIALGLSAYGLTHADTLVSSNNVKPIERTIEKNTNNDEYTNTTVASDIQINKEISYEQAISDIRDITAKLKEAGYFDTNRDLVVTQEMINNTYFVINSSEMSNETAAALVSNGIISSDTDEMLTYTRNMLEVAAIEDNHYAKGESSTYFDILGEFYKAESAKTMYANYVAALETVKGLPGLASADRTETVRNIYSDIITYAMDNNSKTFGNPKSVGAGALYSFNALVRKNILSTMVEMGDVTAQQYETITGYHTEVINGVSMQVPNYEIIKTNDVLGLLNRVCPNGIAYAASDEEVANFRYDGEQQAVRMHRF